MCCHCLQAYSTPTCASASRWAFYLPSPFMALCWRPRVESLQILSIMTLTCLTLLPSYTCMCNLVEFCCLTWSCRWPQELRNIMWIAECVAQDQKSRITDGECCPFVPIVGHT